MKLSNNLIVLDLETTGTWVEKDKIVEIAMIKCFPDGSRDTYLKRVNPGIPIPSDVSELIGITNDDLKDEPFFKEIATEVSAFLSGADLGGFNLERFDLPLLERELFESGHKFEWEKVKTYDAQKIFHINEKRNLTAAYKFYCNKELVNAHSALADTEATLEVLLGQVSKYGEGDDSIEQLGKFDYVTTAEFYDKEKKIRWWNGKLYMMFGKYAKRYSLQEVARKDPKYMEWIISANFNHEVKALIENALNGEFPVFEKDSEQDDGRV